MRHILYEHKYCVFSWPKEYFEYCGEETIIPTQGNISNTVMRRILIHYGSQPKGNVSDGWEQDLAELWQ
jgi:hypothetical protein